MSRTLSVALGFALAVLSGCANRPPAPPPELVPPSLDLAQYRTLGLVEFSGSGRSAALGPAATREFMAALHAAQPGTPVLEIGARGASDPATVRALAKEQGVDVVVLGALTEHKTSPRVAVDAISGVASAAAKLSVSLDVRMLDGASGATLWSASSRREIELAGVDLTLDGVSRINANPADEARRILVRDLIEDVTFDLRPRWVQR
jgi:hypothetical protein